MNSDDPYCHKSSTENYFWSPRMPTKDHLHALKTNSSFFKTESSFIDKVQIHITKKTKKVLGECTMNSTVVNSVMKIK